MQSDSNPSLTETSRGAARCGAGFREDRDGWIYVHVAGTPYDRGYQHGWLLADEIRAAINAIEFLIWEDFATPFSWWAENARAMWLDMLTGDLRGKLTDRSGSSVIEELRGIADGANARREGQQHLISIDDLLGWNGYPELVCQWFPAVQRKELTPAVPLPVQNPAPPPPAKTLAPAAALWSSPVPVFFPFNRHHCSAFVATGDWTADGKIVAAHTTWQRFANGDSYNVILSLEPPAAEGYPILMQTAPGYVASSMDFGQNAAGLVAASTSIDSDGFEPTGLPYFMRARRAGQRATTIEQWVDLFRQESNGGYANSWLLAEGRTGRIAAYELTLQHEEQQTTITSGAYASCNIPLSTIIRVQDTGGSGWDNILMSGARRVRFEQLLEQHKGHIDVAVAQAILSDHHDPYSRSDTPSGRTICGHFDTDKGSGHGPFYPWGSLDGKVTTSALLERQTMSARWGRACGTPFIAAQFFADNPQYRWMRDLTKDRPSRNWTEFHWGRQDEQQRELPQ
jgi:hypothetical protein